MNEITKSLLITRIFIGSNKVSFEETVKYVRGVCPSLHPNSLPGRLFVMEYKADLTVTISRQGKHFIAYCPALDISTSGKSEKEVRSRFDELVRLFVEEIEAAGTTDDVLTELGWQKDAVKGTKVQKWLPPLFKSEQVQVKIPVAV